MSDTDPIGQLLGQFIGRRLPGGCDSCDAYQEVIEHEPSIYILRIFHDDWCPEHPADPDEEA